MSIYSESARDKINAVWHEFRKVCKQHGVKMTQRVAASRLGMTQSSFNQFLNDYNMPLSERFVCGFSYLVGLKPEYFIPELSDIGVGLSVNTHKIDIHFAYRKQDEHQYKGTSS